MSGFFLSFCVCFQIGHGRKNLTSLERIEDGLARARASIQEAILSTTAVNEKQSFVPKGDIYLNPHAFHQLSLQQLLSIFLF